MNWGRRGRVSGVVFSLVLVNLFLGLPAWAEYPEKPINFLMGWAAGGSTDITIRALSETAGKILGQPVIVTNKPGGGSAVALTSLKSEKPDGYTIGNISAGGILSQYMRKVAYNAATDFTPIMRYADYSFGIVVMQDSPFKTFTELVDFARKNPGKIKYSTSGVGSGPHLVMECLARQENFKWTHIPYKGGHEANTALLGGHVDVQSNSTEWKPYVDSGKMRLLATFGPSRLEKYPNAPTWVELGYKVSYISLIGIIGPKGMPQPIVEKLHGAFKKALESPDFKKAMGNYDMPIVYRDPAGLAKDMRDFSDQWGQVIQQLGLKQD